MKGFDTLKAFHKALDDGGFQVSYQTLRNWQRGDREPPAIYYSALHRIFGIRFEFLHDGAGPVSEVDLGERRSEKERFMKMVEAEPRLKRFGSEAILSFFYFIEGLKDACPPEAKPTEEEDQALTRRLTGWVLTPLAVSGQRAFPTEEQRTYLSLVIQAVRSLLPPKGHGKSFPEIHDSFDSVMEGGGLWKADDPTWRPPHRREPSAPPTKT